MNGMAELLSQAWSGGTSTQVQEQVQVLHDRAHSASEAAFSQFEAAHDEQPVWVDEYAWQTRWRNM